MSSVPPSRDRSGEVPVELLGIEPHLDGLAAGSLVIPECLRCQQLIWYPRTFCPACGSAEVEWVTASGHGTVYSFTVVHRSVGAFEGAVPYVLAYVELDEGPRILANILGPFDDVRIDTPVQAVFDEKADFPTLCFVPTDGGSGAL